MRYHIGIASLCSIAFVLGGCGDEVTAPVTQLSGAASAAAPAPTTTVSSGAAQDWGTGVFVGDATVYRDCVGEFVHVHNEMPFRWHRVVTPSGNVMFSDPFIPNAGTGETVGLTTGRIWTLDQVVSPEVIHTNAGMEASFVAVLHWKSETAPDFTMHNTFHFVQNANGEVIVNSFESRCVLQGGAA